ncbi:MAG: amidohydrolase family protein [Azoarcus sp.]|jgi:predicted TIM-barrel fold metal-dependent hydrolase|nr:amidohydrolase family protein [Azoarcus sp.]
MNTVTDAFITRKRASSRSAKVRDLLDYPVIDTDIHTNEFSPLLEDYIAQYGGARLVDVFREHEKAGLNQLAHQWYKLSPRERLDHRINRPTFWTLPARNTYDLGTAAFPRLLYERLGELGSDYGVIYPNITLFAAVTGHEELRRVLARALNHYAADLYRPYADRLTPVAVIPLHTPQEGIEELEFAVRELGLKTAIIPGAVRRPIKALQEKFPRGLYPELARHIEYLDFFGIDSEYDYDPFWAKTIELGVNPTTHSGSQGWDSRNSVTNYMFNHIGHFADASEALAKALFFGGVTHRFPKLRIGLIEGGAGWGADVYTHLVDRWLKRGRDAVQKYNPANADKDFLYSLYEKYGEDLNKGGRKYSRDEIAYLAFGARGQYYANQGAAETEFDDFALAGIESVEDIRDRYIPNFYFGTEADDRTLGYAFNTRAAPLHAQVNMFYSSDIGHWDVPEINTILADTFQLVEEGIITAENFKQLVFTGPYSFYTANNPNFFKGTAVEALLPSETRTQTPAAA